MEGLTTQLNPQRLGSSYGAAGSRVLSVETVQSEKEANNSGEASIPSELDEKGQSLHLQTAHVDDTESSSETDEFSFVMVGHSQTIDETQLKAAFPESLFAKVYSKVIEDYPGMSHLIRHDSATMYKQMIAWIIRCGLVGGSVDCRLYCRCSHGRREPGKCVELKSGVGGFRPRNGTGGNALRGFHWLLSFGSRSHD